MVNSGKLPVCEEVAAISVDMQLTGSAMAVQSLSGTLVSTVTLSDQAYEVPAACSKKRNKNDAM